ncbi:hypothetical protein B0H14DRAFT_2384139, partial [Mycena olivaceomarginata]
SDSAHRRMSKDSKGYPSWLPKRPLHPAPASTYHSELAAPGPSSPTGEVPSTPPPFVGGRKATPRSVRIVSLEGGHVAATNHGHDQPPAPRVCSRGMGVPLFPANAALSAEDERRATPRFRARGLRLELLRSPSPWMRLYFYLWPLLVFAHIPLQTFFDFNAVFVLIQIALHPSSNNNPHNWALAAAAYTACWALWLFAVVLVYEGVYCFARRWRAKRPRVLAVYLSAPAYALAGMTGYAAFCFLQYVRWGAWGEVSCFVFILAESCALYAQNGPTVALLLPRAGIAAAVLIGNANANANGLASISASTRNATFFRADGALTGYAHGVLLANAAWAVWRGVVCLGAWLGLLLLSGAPCGGICGPRHRWEEEAHEKSTAAYADDLSEDEPLPWRGREETAARVRGAWEFCLSGHPGAHAHAKREVHSLELLAGTTPAPTPGFEEMEQVMAAIGFPSAPLPAQRGVLSDELFEEPEEGVKVDGNSAKRRRRRGGVGYPFAGPGAQMSSRDRVMVPFPPSPGPPEAQGDTSGSLEEAEDEEDEDEDDEDLEEDEDEEEEEEEEGLPGSEEPSSGRASGSMSSVGQPVTSRYPFQFRRPARGASASSHATHSTNANTHSTNTRARPTRAARPARTRGCRRAPATANGNGNGRHHSAGTGIAMPLPPRHPQQGRGRSRAGTVPVPAGSASASSLSIPLPVDFPRAAVRERMDSGVTSAFGAGPQPGAPLAEHELLPQAHGEEAALESEGSHEHAGEREDRVGLLSPRASNVSLGAHRRGYSHSRSNSRSNSHSGGGSGHHSRTQSSHSGSSHSRSRAGSMGGVRSRAQSLLQAVASHSSIELVQRLRANSSMARLEDVNGNQSDAARTTTNTHSRSGSGTTSDAVPSSGGENNTFGHPLRTTWHNAPQQQEQQQSPPTPVEEEGSEEGREEVTGRLHAAQSRTSVFSAAPSSVLSSPSIATEQQASRAPSPERRQAESAGIPIPVIRPPPHDLGVSSPSSYGSETTYPDVSTAPQSFVTAPATIEGSTTKSSGGRTDGLESWGVAAGGAHLRDASRGGGQGAWGHYGPV